MQCVVNPELGNEFRRLLRIAPRRRRIAIVGGGPAGMEAARSAAIRGHEVVLLEAEQEIGGQLRHSMRPTFHRREMIALLDWWKAELGRLKVEVRVGNAVTPESIDGLVADEVLIATGPVWEIPKTLLDLFGPCVTSHEVLLDLSRMKESVIVAGGTEAGLNAAIALAESGRTTSLVESAAIGPEISDLMRNEILRHAEAVGVQLLEHALVTAARRRGEEWELSLAGQDAAKRTLTAHDVVVSPIPRGGIGVWRAVPAVRFLGTVAAPTGRLYQATQDGFWATADA
jgi:NADPH-dependent 2,4-dienoyl-CoA reductase/sulfur reductase-like enzyme